MFLQLILFTILASSLRAAARSGLPSRQTPRTQQTQVYLDRRVSAERNEDFLADRDYWDRLVGTPSRLALETKKEGVLPTAKYSMGKFRVEPFQEWLREHSLVPKVDPSSDGVLAAAAAAAADTRETATSSAQSTELPSEGSAAAPSSGAALAAGIPPPPLSFICGVWYSPLYKFIFVRNRKTASSTFLTAVKKYMLEKGLCNMTKDGLHPNNCILRMEPENLLAEGLDADTMWREYLVITSTRNPWARAASGYQFTFDKWQKTDGSCKQPTFLQFCKDPFIMGKLSNLFNCVTQREGVGSRHDGHWNFDFCHVEPAAPCMLDDGGSLVVDFVIRYERLEEDMQAATRLINERRPAGLPPIEIPRSIKWRNKGTMAKAYDINSTDEAAFVYADKYRLCGAPCVDALTEFYATDLQVFGWDPPGPPPPASEYMGRPLRPMLASKPPSGRHRRKDRHKASKPAVKFDLERTSDDYK